MKFHKLLIALLILAATITTESVTAQFQIDSAKAKVMGRREYVTNTDSLALNGVYVKAGALSAQTVYVMNFPDSVKTYISNAMLNLWKFRDTITYRDTLTEATPFKSYNFGSQYELVTITVTKNDTAAVVWDSVKFYSVSSYGDTALTGVRYTETFTDSTFVRVNWSAGTRTSSKKVLFLDPICKIMHVRLENYALTNRSVILTIRGAKR